MVDTVSSLYTLCLNETTDLLMAEYWSQQGVRKNPFKTFPPAIVHDLVSSVCINTDDTLDVSHLFLLLQSGRIINFKLHDVKIDLNTAENIFDAIFPFTGKLKTMQLKDLDTSFGYFIPYNFGHLLRSSTSLVYLETCIRFQFNDISNCVYLQKLVLDFSFFDSLKSFVIMRDVTSLNFSVKVLNITQFQINRTFYCDIGKILQYFVELVELNQEVTRAIQYLHAVNAVTMYKLRKTILGDDIGATCVGIRLTSVFCPYLTEVEVSPEDNSALLALSNFRYITVLTIYEPTTWGNSEYRLGVHRLLQNSHFGRKLKSLGIIRFSGVCFASIGVFCPNLKELRLELISEYNMIDFAPDSYEKLVSLYIEMENHGPCKETSLIGLLSNATDLEFLTIKNARTLNDTALNKIFKNNAVFSKLKAINIPYCGLTINGLKKFAKKLSSAKYFSMCSSIIKQEDAEEVVKPLNLQRFEWIEEM